MSCQHLSCVLTLTAANVLQSILSCVLTPTALRVRLGLDGLFWFYSGCCLAFAIFAVVWVPETQGKSVEDILKAM